MSYATPPVPGDAPLNLPLYGAGIAQAAQRFWKKYVVFSGRASRSEYWWWFLVSAVVALVLYGIAYATGGSMVNGVATISGPGAVVYYLWAAATFIPSLALSWRRLHDTNRSGLWIFIGLIPLVGAIILLVFYVSGPNPAGQRFDR